MTDIDRDLQSVTVQQAQSWLRTQIRRGATCPCCRQYVKEYRRPLSSGMARWLIWLVKSFEHRLLHNPKSTQDDIWIDVKDSPVRGGDYAKLLHWSLVAQRPGDDRINPPRGHGLWQPTIKGINFAHNRIKVPSHLFIYNNRVLRVADTEITIQETLGKGFSYQEIMQEPCRTEMA